MKSRKKSIAIFVLISIIPFLAGMGIILPQSDGAIRKNAQGFLLEYSITIARNIEAFFERKANHQRGEQREHRRAGSREVEVQGGIGAGLYLLGSTLYNVR
jgi:hypothetical protein